MQKQAAGSLPSQYTELGDLVAIDGSLIDSVLSMCWADYQTNSKKAKLHLGFDLNHSIPSKLFLTEGKGAERPFVSKIIEPGQTGVLDRGYQAHHLFDQWQKDQCHFVCRIKESTKQDILEEFPVLESSHVFFDAKVLLGTPNVNQTQTPVSIRRVRQLRNQIRNEANLRADAEMSLPEHLWLPIITDVSRDE